MLALFSDVHGNEQALGRVLADAEAAGATRWVCLGDVAFNGPHPRQALARVRELGCPVVMGNTDAWLLDPAGTEGLPKVVGDRMAWCAKQLNDDELDFVRTFEPTVELDLGGASLLCFHGSPRSFNDVILDVTPADALAPMLDGADHALLAGGHTHLPLLRRLGAQTLLNPGSVGLPFRAVAQPGRPMRALPHAEYALVSAEDGLLSVALRRVALPLEAMFEAAGDVGLPEAEAWCAMWDAPA